MYTEYGYIGKVDNILYPAEQEALEATPTTNHQYGA